MRPLGSLALLAASAVTSALLVLFSHRASQTSHSPLVGLYEYEVSSSQSAPFALEVTFLDWSDPKIDSQLRSFLHRAIFRHRLPLLTLEPFPDRRNGRRNADLLADVLSGRHDAAIARIARTLAAHPSTVLLRFGHEMDKPGHYPWAYRDPDRYIRLYHYVYGRFNLEKPTNLRWIWSPAGTPNAVHYWPGDHYVDLIGLSIYASRAWTSDRRLESFSDQLNRQWWIARRYGRPVLVAEAGVSGSAADQQRWIGDALSTFQHYPELCGLVYFQAPQPLWMPLATGHENWALKPKVLQWFQRQLPVSPRYGRSCVES